MRIFCDLDGTLADFDAAYHALTGMSPVEARKKNKTLDWNALRAPNFYADIQPMAGMQELWEQLKPYKPTILTGIPRDLPAEVIFNKKEWVEKWLGPDVPVITCFSSQKFQYGQSGDLLIDDYEKYKYRWTLMGGRWITFINSWDAMVKFEQLVKEK